MCVCNLFGLEWLSCEVGNSLFFPSPSLVVLLPSYQSVSLAPRFKASLDWFPACEIIHLPRHECSMAFVARGAYGHAHVHVWHKDSRGVRVV